LQRASLEHFSACYLDNDSVLQETALAAEKAVDLLRSTHQLETARESLWRRFRSMTFDMTRAPHESRAADRRKGIGNTLFQRFLREP
jgi:hypothetical protein